MENLQEPNVDEFLINISSSIMNKRDSSDGVKNQQEFIEDVKSECSKLNRIEIEKTKVMGSILMIKFKRVRTYFYFCYECQEYFGMKKNGNNKSAYHTLSHHKRFEKFNESESSRSLELTIEILISLLLYSSKTEILVASPIPQLDLEFCFKNYREQKSENLMEVLTPLCQTTTEDHRLEISLSGLIFPAECEELTIEILNKSEEVLCVFNILYYSGELKTIRPLSATPCFTLIKTGIRECFPKNEVWVPKFENELNDNSTNFVIIYYTFIPTSGAWQVKPSQFLTKVFPILIVK